MMRSPWANPTDIRPDEFLAGEHGVKGETMDEFTENDLRAIERERDLPPDESHWDPDEGDDPYEEDLSDGQDVT